jgi:hypothetical protein
VQRTWMERKMKIKGLFCIHVWPTKWYGPKCHNFTSLGCRILTLQVRGPK